MKIRNGFVSNSSSSSFIVISNKGEYVIPSWGNDHSVDFGPQEFGGEGGKYKFGWEKEFRDDILSKINFCYIQAREVNNQDWIQMLEEVIKEETGINRVNWFFPDDKYGYPVGYVDHQSSSIEGRNTEMFHSKKNLMNFLFNDKSYIQGGNDNED